ARRRPGRLGQALERRADERVLGEALDPQHVRRRERDPVGQLDALQNRCYFVPPVLAERPDDEGQVQLGRCERLAHLDSAFARARNSGGASSSALTVGSRPISARAPVACARVARPASSSEFARRLRRWANAAVTTSFTRAKSGGTS